MSRVCVCFACEAGAARVSFPCISPVAAFAAFLFLCVLEVQPDRALHLQLAAAVGSPAAACIACLGCLSAHFNAPVSRFSIRAGREGGRAAVAMATLNQLS